MPPSALEPGDPNAQRRVVLVDGADRELGESEILDAHVLPGTKHRAFTALLFREDGALLLARRAAGKFLWAGHWDGTVASHPMPGEGYAAAGERRMPEELGIECALSEHGRFDYHMPYGEVGAENEVCATLVGLLPQDVELRPVAGEISEVRWITCEQMLAELSVAGSGYCPWLALALLCLAQERASLSPEQEVWLGPWCDATSRAREAIEASLRADFPDQEWHLLGR